MIRTHIRRVAPDWDLRRTLYWLTDWATLPRQDSKKIAAIVRSYTWKGLATYVQNYSELVFRFSKQKDFFCCKKINSTLDQFIFHSSLFQTERVWKMIAINWNWNWRPRGSAPEPQRLSLEAAGDESTPFPVSKATEEYFLWKLLEIQRQKQTLPVHHNIQKNWQQCLRCG